MEIKLKTSAGHDTTITVKSKVICDGAATIAIIRCDDRDSAIQVFDDEIDNLIAALQEIKKELR